MVTQDAISARDFAVVSFQFFLRSFVAFLIIQQQMFCSAQQYRSRLQELKCDHQKLVQENKTCQRIQKIIQQQIDTSVDATKKYQEQLDDLEHMSNQASVIDIDVLLQDRAYLQLPLTMQGLIVWYDLETYQQRYDAIQVIIDREIQRYQERHAISRTLSETYALRDNFPSAFSVVGLDALQQKILQAKRQVQQHWQTHQKQLIDQYMMKIKDRIVAGHNTQDKLQILLRHKAENAGLIKQNMHDIQEALDQTRKNLRCHGIVLSKKWKKLACRIVSKKLLQDAFDYRLAEEMEQKNIEELAAMQREDDAMHVLIEQKQQQQEKDRLLAEWYAVQDQVKFSEMKRREEQSKSDKEKHLQKIVKINHELQQKKALRLQHAAQQQKITQEKKIQKIQNVADSLAWEVNQIELLAQQNVCEEFKPTIDPKLLCIKLKPKATLQEFKIHVGDLVNDFNAKINGALIVLEDGVGRMAESDVMYAMNRQPLMDHFGDLYAVLLDLHKELINGYLGLSHYMAVLDKKERGIYKKMFDAYTRLTEDACDAKVQTLQNKYDIACNKMSVAEKNLEDIQRVFKQAQQDKNKEQMRLSLPLLKQRTDEFNELETQKNLFGIRLQELYKKVDVSAQLSTFFAPGGILDPHRLLHSDKFDKLITLKALSQDVFNEKFLSLINEIDAIKKQYESVSENQPLDPELQITASEEYLVFQAVKMMILDIFNVIGLGQHPDKDAWVVSMYEKAKKFALLDAQERVDLDNLQYYLYTSFIKSGWHGSCSHAQYNTQQDIVIALIRLFACKFHDKKPYIG